MNLQLIKKHCEFDSCTNPESACSSLEQAAKECRNAGICIDWRNLTDGSCGTIFFFCFVILSHVFARTFVIYRSGVSLKRQTFFF